MKTEKLERRLAAILVADMVGYSRLMEADEAGTRAQLKTLRKDLIDPKMLARSVAHSAAIPESSASAAPATGLAAAEP